MLKKQPFKHVDVLGFSPEKPDIKNSDVNTEETKSFAETDNSPIDSNENSNPIQNPNPDATEGDKDADMTKNEPIPRIDSNE